VSRAIATAGRTVRFDDGQITKSRFQTQRRAVDATALDMQNLRRSS
jgi:hypothetical protein